MRLGIHRRAYWGALGYAAGYMAGHFLRVFSIGGLSLPNFVMAALMLMFLNGYIRSKENSEKGAFVGVCFL